MKACRLVQRHCLPQIEIEQLMKSFSNLAMALAWIIVLFLAADLAPLLSQFTLVSAQCPAPEEHKVGQLATMFKEWTSTKTKQMLAERNETLPEVKLSTSSFANCSSPMAYVLAQQKRRSHESFDTYNNTNSKFDPNDQDYLDFMREIREKYMTIFDVKPADEFSRIIFKNREPRWIDICQARPDRNETWIHIEMGDPPKYHSAATIEKDRRERGTFIKQVAARRGHTLTPQAQYELDILSRAVTSGTTPSSWTPASYTPQDRRQRRRRRSISVMNAHYTNGDDTKSAFRATVVGREKKSSAALVYKKPVSKIAAKSQWSAKKTSFSFSSSNFITANRLAQYKSHHSSKNSYFVAPSEELYQAQLTLTNSTSAPLSAQEKERIEKRIGELVLNLFQIDLRVTWFHNHALNTLNHVREHLGWLKRVLADKGAADVRPERLEHISSLNRMWFPRLDDLAWKDGQRVTAQEAGLFSANGAVYDKRHRTLLLNLTQYVQFFGVALEQMKYDQLHLNVSGRTDDTLYRGTDRLLNKLQCETENVMKLELEFSHKRAEFEQLYLIHHPTSVVNIDEFYHKLVKHTLGHDRAYTGGELESPIARAFAKFTEEQQRKLILNMATYSPEMELRLKMQRERNETHKIIKPRHLWREIMPLEARQIADPKERAARDLEILKELTPTLDCYESLLLTSFT